LKCRLGLEAEADLNTISGYVAEANPRAAQTLVEKFDRRFSLLERLPNAGRARPEYGTDIRSLTVHPYVILYRVEPDAVVVIRIVHGARDIEAMLRGTS
jgi:toxin ParE1/3/4